MFTVIDTNVLVSAMLKFNSVPGIVVKSVVDGVLIPLLSSEIIAEYSDVLLREKFHLNKDIVYNMIKSFKTKGLFIQAKSIDIVLPDPNDKKFYEIFIEKKKTDSVYLVTGNIKHFPIDAYIVNPRDMLNIIEKNLLI